LFEEPLLRYANMPKAAQNLPDARTVHEDRGIVLEVFQCAGCGLVQLNRPPVPYYQKVIRASAISREMTRFRRRQFAGFVKAFSLKDRKVIEVGCGRGEYLTLLRCAGADAFGVEQSAASARACAQQDLRVDRGFVRDGGPLLRHAPFQAFLILNFLEHLPDPGSTLRGIGRNLTAGAVGLVEVPNFDRVLRRHLFSTFIGDHLSYFTKDTLQTALRINGFEVLRCAAVWHDSILSAMVRKHERVDPSPFNARQEQLTRNITRHLDRLGGQRVAVWGAGHQALTVMALANLAGRIRYVVDSAAFKQGRFTPATHLRIVAPEHLDSEPVDAILVMADAYSGEVVRQIRGKYGDRIRIAIVREEGVERIGPPGTGRGRPPKPGRSRR
jgi:SAM-dependent methyltransferase